MSHISHIHMNLDSHWDMTHPHETWLIPIQMADVRHDSFTFMCHMTLRDMTCHSHPHTHTLAGANTHTHTHTQRTQTHTQTSLMTATIDVSDTGWPRLRGCLQLQVIFRKRATNYRALFRKMTYEDMASYGSSPPCRRENWWWWVEFDRNKPPPPGGFAI